MLDNMKAINIYFENGDSILLDANNIKDFYISNIDEDGNEIPYEPSMIKNKLFANFVLLKIKTNTSDAYKYERIKARQDITEITIIFNNMKCIKFIVASNADPFVNAYQNDYEYIYEDDNSLGLLLSKYNVKYKNNLFI